MLTVQEVHDKVLYPVVRVRTGNSGGSGVLIYSEPDPDNEGRYINIALTCQHVVDSAIKIRDEFDPVLKQQRKSDYFEEVAIEVFDYDGSKLISSNSTQADIIAYDKHHDLAAVRLHNFRKQPFVSSIIPKDEIEKLQIASPVVTCGCSLLHDPFPNNGTLTYLREVIEQKAYLMSNAPSIFGNSGGGLFHGETGHLLGLTSRVTVTQMGFGMDVQTWMNFSTHPDRLYEFFEHQELQFLYDKDYNYKDAIRRRESKRREALRSIILEDHGIDESEL
tara:strand:- start:802 stop:1632 length:831 start_codon:yes stop_codon:yes gene_type:complete